MSIGIFFRVLCSHDQILQELVRCNILLGIILTASDIVKGASAYSS